ncbi:MAG: universal stress protein [Gemmatimonadota bacterium]
MSSAILVPLDGSVFAEQALPFALSLAHQTNSPLHPVMVHAEPQFHDIGEWTATIDAENLEEKLRERETAYLESVAERLTSEHVPVHDPVLLEGDVVVALTDHVRTHAIGRAVLSTHGRGGLERLWLPSVAEALLHRLTIPLLFVRPEPDASEADVVHAAPPFRTVLVTLDGSQDAEAVLNDAFDFADADDARFILLRVVPPPPLLASAYLPHAALMQREESEHRRAQARAYMDAVEQSMEGRAAAIDTRIVLHGRPATVIQRVADDEQVDLIGMGTHGHSGLREMLLGSVTRDVVRSSAVPVLVHRVAD